MLVVDQQGNRLIIIISFSAVCVVNMPYAAVQAHLTQPLPCWTPVQPFWATTLVSKTQLLGCMVISRLWA